MINTNDTASTIYIQIAAYRDPELNNTIKSCLENAAHPENLTFGIAWQHSPYEEWDNLDEYKLDARFNIIDIDYRDARGPCWARHQLNLNYNNEKYALQLDSHHRFVKNWDVILIEMLEGLRSDTCRKPLLSSYLPSFNPDDNTFSETPWIMEFDRIAPEGPVHFLPHSVDDWKELSSPIPSRFISGHFIFSDGIFCKEVIYDPTYYFHGEEINLSVRAYMAGYDLFAPHKLIIWHEYIRNSKKKHWDDHPQWLSLDTKSYAHNKELLGIDNFSSENTLTKNVRTLREYERYAGIHFSTRRVHTNTLDRKRPPSAIDDESFENGLVKFHRMCIDVYRPSFTETDYNVWVIAFEDKNGVEIYRADAGPEEITRLLNTSDSNDLFIHIWRNFYTEALPAKWIVWPHSESKGWMDRLTGEFRI